jgi:hypothetical protein
MELIGMADPAKRLALGKMLAQDDSNIVPGGEG